MDIEKNKEIRKLYLENKKEARIAKELDISTEYVSHVMNTIHVDVKRPKTIDRVLSARARLMELEGAPPSMSRVAREVGITRARVWQIYEKRGIDDTEAHSLFLAKKREALREKREALREKREALREKREALHSKIRELCEFKSQSQVARELGISQCHVSRICNFKA